MDASSEQELHTRSSWTELGDAQTQMDFIVVSSKLEAKRVQVMDLDWFKTDHRGGSGCSFIEIATQTNSETWSKFERMETKRSMAKSGHRDADRLEELGCAGKSEQNDGDQGDDRDRNGAQNSSVAKAERRKAPRASRGKQTLQRIQVKMDIAEARGNISPSP